MKKVFTINKFKNVVKRPIAYKLTLLISAVMLLSILFAGVFGSVFMEKYYAKSKQSDIKDIYKSFSEISKKDPSLSDEADVHTLNKLCEQTGATAIVVDQYGMVRYLYGSSELLHQRWQDLVFGNNQNSLFKSDVIEKNKDMNILYTFDKQNSTRYYELTSKLPNGCDVVIRLSVENFKESLLITNKFYLGLAIAMIIVITILLVIVTRNYTIPMLELADLSKRMSELDFDAKYTGSHNDEIDVLGNSMNEMSEKLEKTITELKAANLELSKDIAEKEEVDEMRKEFISNVSHELKTPIALIQGYSEALTDGMDLSEEDVKYYCEVIRDETEKMNKMVSNLLSLNQIEFGNTKLNIERFDIVEVVKSMVDRISKMHEDSEVEVILDLPDSCSVWGDEFMIEEVITNYLNNAYNHVDDRKLIKVQVVPKNGIVRVSVFNSGRTIPEEDIDNIWQKFYKVDKARTREYGGNGIGLSIVKAVMDSHEKDCGVINHIDGVEFWFELDTKEEISKI